MALHVQVCVSFQSLSNPFEVQSNSMTNLEHGENNHIVKLNSLFGRLQQQKTIVGYELLKHTARSKYAHVNPKMPIYLI